jgi:tetratricopeptide (TPR) repeat protein
MSKPQPKTKAEELFKQVNGLSLDDRKSGFMLKRLTKEAQSIASVDPVVSSMCLGIISFFENKHDDAMRLFSNALKISPGDSLPVQNYAVILFQMGFYKESLQYANTAYKLNKADTDCLDTAIFANNLNGNFDTVHELLLRASKLRLNSDHITMDNNILQFMRSNSISPSDFVKLQDTAYSLLHSRNIFIMKPSLEILEDEDSMFLSYEILIDKPVMEIVDLSVMHARALAQEPSLLEISDKVIISFTSWCE